MKKSILTIVIGLFLAMINSCGIIDDKESKVRDFLDQKVNSESQGSIKLNNLKKTNGYDQELMGMKMYILEWSADISVQREIWKVGNNLEGYWQNFSVTFEKPGFWDAYASVNMPKHLGIGASILLTGESKLHKTEQGWIVEELNIKTYQILNEGSLPENKFIGKWHIDGGSYLKIEKEKNESLVFCEGFKNEGYPITWCEDNPQNQFYMELENGKLVGKISSYNFRATHGQTFEYKITLTLLSENKLQYSVWSSISGETDTSEAIKMND